MSEFNKRYLVSEYATGKRQHNWLAGNEIVALAIECREHLGIDRFIITDTESWEQFCFTKQEDGAWKRQFVRTWQHPDILELLVEGSMG